MVLASLLTSARAVVILTGRDYAGIETRVSRFEALQNSKEGQPWEAPKAAIGYALYDRRTDNGVEAVFQRADSKMYEQKKRMKAVHV